MVTIIHGDDTAKSRAYFQELKQKEKNSISFIEGKFSLTDLFQNIEGSGLFGETNTFFIENLFTDSRKTDKGFKEILKFISDHSDSFKFVFWEPKEISKRDCSIFKNAEISIFKLPKNIFLFLDNFKPNNSNNLLKLFHQAIDSGIKEELILFMMQRQIRILLALYDPSENNQIDEASRLATWQLNKLESQTKAFDKNKLINLSNKLFEIEKAQKTGQLPLSLIQNIDFLLLEM